MHISIWVSSVLSPQAQWVESPLWREAMSTCWVLMAQVHVYLFLCFFGDYWVCYQGVKNLVFSGHSWYLQRQLNSPLSQMHASVSKKESTTVLATVPEPVSSHAAIHQQTFLGEMKRPGQASPWGPHSFTHHGAGVLFQFSLWNGLFMVEEKVSEKVLWCQRKSDIEHSEQKDTNKIQTLRYFLLGWDCDLFHGGNKMLLNKHYTEA